MGDQRCHPWRMRKLLLLLPAIWLLSACSSQRDECARLLATFDNDMAEKIAKKKGFDDYGAAYTYCGAYLQGGGN